MGNHPVNTLNGTGEQDPKVKTNNVRIMLVVLISATVLVEVLYSQFFRVRMAVANPNLLVQIDWMLITQALLVIGVSLWTLHNLQKDVSR